MPQPPLPAAAAAAPRRASARLAACLIAIFALAVPIAAQMTPYPPDVFPAANPPSPQKAVLGKMLFWEEQLSSDGTMACGTCHRPESGGLDPRAVTAAATHPGADGQTGTADDVQGSPGVVRCLPGGGLDDDGLFFPRPQVTPRLAPSPFDRMFTPELFWDGRAGGAFVDPDTGQTVITSGGALENLALQPTQSDVEMACQARSISQVVARIARARPTRLATSLPADITAALAANATYPDLYAAAFGTPVVTARRTAFALATYLRTLKSDQTPYDLFIAGNTQALTPAQQSGLTVFLGLGRCVACHAPPLFSDDAFHVNGLTDAMLDAGRRSVTGLPAHQGAMKTPSLRNVGLRETVGLTHAGTVATIDDAVAGYDAGGVFPFNLDPAIVPLFLPPNLMADLVDFLRNGLTDPRAAAALPPFDRPTLRTEGAPNPSTIGAGSPGSGGFVPEVVALQPPHLGNRQFTLGVARGPGGAGGGLVLNPFPAPPGTTLPNGAPLHVSLVPTPFVVPVTLLGSGAGRGYASVQIVIPDHPPLAGFQVFGQWFLSDAMAAGGVSSSPGFALTLQP